MALVLNDRVKETSTTTGTGTFSLGGAVDGFESFVTGIADGNTTYYAAVNRNADEFEVGIGTVTDASPDTLARTTILSSSNSDSAVDFSAGTKDIFVTLPASKVAFEDASNDVTIGNDLILGSDSAVLKFGADSDTTLTHTDGTGLTLNSTNKLLFRDTGLYINSSTDGQLDLVADTEIQIAATTVDINGNVEISGDLTVSGDDITMGTNTAGNILVADGTNFNSIAATDLSAISTIASGDTLLAVDASGGGLKKVARSVLVAGLATSSAISNISEDDTPQLGGNLDMNGSDIVTTSNATIDLAPNGTGTVVVRGNTNSGAIKFNCESNTHGQTLKAQPHSASVTNNMLLPAGADSTLVSLVSTDTLTNKTLTSPKINEDVAVTSTATELNLLDGVSGLVQADLTKLAAIDATAAEIDNLDALSRGSLIYGNASAATAILTKGTADQVLTSDGTDIAWQDAGGGGMGALVHTSTISSNTANIVIDGIFSSTYKNYLIVGMARNNTSDVTLEMRYRQGGSTITTSNYRRTWNGNYGTTSSSVSDYGSATYGDDAISVINNMNSNTYSGAYFNITLFNPLGTANYKNVMFQSISESVNSPKSFMNLTGNGLFYANTTALTGLDFYLSSELIAEATIKIYGLL